MPQSSPIVNYAIKFLLQTARVVVCNGLHSKIFRSTQFAAVDCCFIAVELCEAKQIVMKCKSRAREEEKAKNHMRLVEISIIVVRVVLIAVYPPSVHESTLDWVESRGVQFSLRYFDEVRNTFTTHWLSDWLVYVSTFHLQMWIKFRLKLHNAKWSRNRKSSLIKIESWFRIRIKVQRRVNGDVSGAKPSPQLKHRSMNQAEQISLIGHRYVLIWIHLSPSLSLATIDKASTTSVETRFSLLGSKWFHRRPVDVRAKVSVPLWNLFRVFCEPRLIVHSNR